MNTYMLLLYADEKAGMTLPKEAMAGWMDRMQAYAEALEKAGAHVAHGALGPTSEATTVTAPRGEMQVHNGPFAETKEQLGGYYMIKAESMEAAQRWAARCPGAIWGKVEIRLVRG
jgi:hypothetical protein